MSKILVISDVHGNKEILEHLLKKHKKIETKVYLGDFQMSKKDQEYYSNFFDYVVMGNCDYPGISKNSIYVEIDNKKVMITHGHYFGSILKKIDFSILNKSAKENSCEVILHGHDHISVVEKKSKITRFNPGSTTFPRNTRHGSYGIIDTTFNEWVFNIVKIS